MLKKSYATSINAQEINFIKIFLCYRNAWCKQPADRAFSEYSLLYGCHGRSMNILNENIIFNENRKYFPSTT